MSGIVPASTYRAGESPATLSPATITRGRFTIEASDSSISSSSSSSNNYLQVPAVPPTPITPPQGTRSLDTAKLVNQIKQALASGTYVAPCNPFSGTIDFIPFKDRRGMFEYADIQQSAATLFQFNPEPLSREVRSFIEKSVELLKKEMDRLGKKYKYISSNLQAVVGQMTQIDGSTPPSEFSRLRQNGEKRLNGLIKTHSPGPEQGTMEDLHHIRELISQCDGCLHYADGPAIEIPNVFGSDPIRIQKSAPQWKDDLAALENFYKDYGTFLKWHLAYLEEFNQTLTRVWGTLAEKQVS